MTTPDTARADADADPAATLAALRKTWGAREQRLIDLIDSYERLKADRRLTREVQTELRPVRELLDFIGR